MFYRQSHGVHRGYAFEDCHIIGGYDHVERRGAPSKWGIYAHSLADFRFEGLVPGRYRATLGSDPAAQVAEWELGEDGLTDQLVRVGP